MSSTDGPPGDEERGEEPIDESVLPPGPRRSTYTPPVPRQPAEPTLNDDELADLIAANLASATGAINVVYQLDDVEPSLPMGAPVEQLPPPPPGARILPKDDAAAAPQAPTTPPAGSMPSPDASAVPADLPPPVDAEPLFTDPEPAAAAPPTYDLDEETTARQPAPELADEQLFVEPEYADARYDDAIEEETTARAPEAVFDLPVIPPVTPTEPFDQAAALAASAAPAGQRPWIPERQSLRDDELSALLENGAAHPGGTLGMMEELERQMKLREEETREFQEWQESMLAVGTPEALAAVEQVLPEFSDIVSLSTSAIPVQQPPAAEEVAPAPIFDAPPPSSPPLSDVPPPVVQPSYDEPVFTEPVYDEPAYQEPPSEAPIFDAPPPAFAAPTSDAPPPYVAPEPEPDLGSPIDEIPVFATPVMPPPLVEPPSVPDAWDIPAGTAVPDSEADPIFIEPVPVGPEPLIEPAPFGGGPFVDTVFTGSVPVITGSMPVTPQRLDVEGDDDVDATDQMPAAFDDLLGAHPGTAPVEPIFSPRIPEDEVVLGDSQELERPRVFSLESAGLEPTPTEQRVGRAARMFWMWFAANSSIVSIAFGAVLLSLGLSLRQAIVGILAGVAISFLPLGLGTLAGKRSGQPTMVVSRAAFGVVGNSIPALIAFLSRVFWGAVLLWLLASGTSEILVGAELTGGLDPSVLTLIAMAGGFVIALVVALFGYGMLARFQLVVSIIAGILVIGVIALTYSYIDIPAALTHPDGSWFLAGTVAVLVFSFIGLIWANSSGDLARYQRPGTSGAGAMLWTTFGAAVPTFLLISYGALLAASNTQIATGLLELPFDTIGRLLPVWYPVPLIAAVTLSLISGVIVTIYSGGFALKAVGLSLGRPAAAIVTGALVAGGAVLLTMVSADLIMLFRDLATTIAVPVAAWAGIFAADTMIRNRRYHSDSLLQRGGIYPSVNWANLVAFLLITAIGFGLTTASVAGLDWQGYIFTLADLPLDGAFAATDLGVFAALLLGLLVPIITGIPRIRRQEAATPPDN